MGRAKSQVIRSYFSLNLNGFKDLRYTRGLTSVVFEFSGFRLDCGARRLEWHGEPVALTAKQFDLLVALVERAGRPVDKQELRELVWADVHVEENNLTQHVFQLRKALGRVAGEMSLIETLPKVGYQFVAAVSRPTVAEAEPEPAPRRRARWPWLVAAAALLLVTVGYGRRQWEFWMADDTPRTNAWATVAIHPLEGPAGSALAAEVAAGLGRLDRVHILVVQPMSGGDGDYNLRGSVREGKVAAEFRRRNGDLIWQREWDAPLGEVTGELIGQTAVTLHELAGARRRGLTSRKPTASPEAFEHYLEGVQRLLARRSLDIRPAIEAFQRSLRADPNYSAAYNGMALAYAWQGFNQAEAPAMVWPRARELAQKALTLDPENGEARLVLAIVLAYADQNEAEAERLVRQVMASDPGSVYLQVLAGQMLSRFGRFGEAEELLRGAIAADPSFGMTRQILAHHYYMSRQFDLAKREAWRIIRMNPRGGTGYGLLVPPLWMTGDWRTAAWIVGRAEAAGLNQPMVAMGLAYTYGRVGRVADAMRIIQAMDEQAKMLYVSPYQRAVAHMGVGQEAQAVSLLRECLAMGCINPSTPRLEPVFDPLRGRADFSALVR
jgi:DNA-binding winged helix-turn-helix (wHTH) protein/tetratricopeptide (TPR) repeat protein